MSEVVDHLAELTGFRDRDVLDVTLVGAFRDLLRPECVAIYRPVGEAGKLHWLTRARLRAHETPVQRTRRKARAAAKRGKIRFRFTMPKAPLAPGEAPPAA